MAYIEANPLVMQSLVIVDRDRTDADLAADLVGLSHPTYVVSNPHTGTGHIVYALVTPVCLIDAAHRRPINLLARVEQGLATVLNGDAAHGGHITKKPSPVPSQISARSLELTTPKDTHVLSRRPKASLYSTSPAPGPTALSVPTGTAQQAHGRPTSSVTPGNTTRPASPTTSPAVPAPTLMLTIGQIYDMSRGTYGAPRVHAELKIGLGIRCGRKRVAWLMRDEVLQGVCHRRLRTHIPAPATHDDLVRRQFHADGPDRLWFTDITQHRATDGWAYCCAVMGAWSRKIVGWAIADRIRIELVIDALETAPRCGPWLRPRRRTWRCD